MKEWSTLRKLMLLNAIAGGGGSTVLTVTGVSPLSLVNAVAHSLISLTQTGKCSQASTPTPTSPVDIYCNNGALKWDSVNQRIYADGTPEVITVTHADSTTQTAGAENLFAVGDYADTQEIISGAVTRNCGVLAFDGTEDWTRTSIGDGCTVFSIGVNAHSISGWSKITSLCTHFECYVGSTSPTYIAANAGKFWLNTAGQYFRFVVAGTMTLTQFTAWLTEQYEAGTPVIVIYPLAEPTTETVTGQPLSTTAGTNTVSVSAEVSDINLEVKYKGVSE